MFEQSLYKFEPVATPMINEIDVDLFKSYELKNWNFSPRIYKILVMSMLANAFALLIFAQTSLLTMKGCDSPLVGRVCEVLDTVSVGSMLFGTDREYVDVAYEKTELGDSEITFVDVTGVTPPLSYPDGYFQLANPVEFEAKLDQYDMPPLSNDFGLPFGFPITKPSTGNSLLDTKPQLPKTNPNVIDGDLPTFNSSPGVPIYPKMGSRKPNRGGQIKSSLPDANDVAIVTKPSPMPTPTPAPSSTPITSDPVTVEINKKPLVDFADDVAAKWDAKQVDLDQPFTIAMNGLLTAEGKLDREKSKFDLTKSKGDPKMIDVAKLAIEAVGDSGFLTYLKSLDVDKFTVTLVQDDKQITAVISSAQKTPERANTVATGIRNSISLGKIAVQNPSDERTLLDAATVTSDGKNFLLNFAIPKPVAQEMITRKLKEAQAKKAQQQKPNGNAITKPTTNAGQR
ncbi:hypothetical protein BH10ACI2_BH10ACI2_23810 [soil metagenome]